MTRDPGFAKKPSELTENELDVLTAAYVPWNSVCHLPLLDQFMISDGYRTRAGRSMRGARYIAQIPGAVAWLPQVPGAGKRATDQPCRVFGITREGLEALRRRMGPDSFAQLATTCREWAENHGGTLEVAG